MRRRFFFWLEKLKISRNERYVVGSLLFVLAGLAIINAVMTPQPLIDEERYADLDKRFASRTKKIKQQRKQLLGKYHGKEKDTVRPDTVRRDSTGKQKSRTKNVKNSRTLINVNTANEKKLQKLTGIGPAYSHRIVVYRQKNGLFKSKNELMEIKGIGKKRLAKIKPFIKLTVQK